MKQKITLSILILPALILLLAGTANALLLDYNAVEFRTLGVEKARFQFYNTDRTLVEIPFSYNAGLDRLVLSPGSEAASGLCEDGIILIQGRSCTAVEIENIEDAYILMIDAKENYHMLEIENVEINNGVIEMSFKDLTSGRTYTDKPSAIDDEGNIQFSIDGTNLTFNYNSGNFTAVKTEAATRTISFVLSGNEGKIKFLNAQGNRVEVPLMGTPEGIIFDDDEAETCDRRMLFEGDECEGSDIEGVMLFAHDRQKIHILQITNVNGNLLDIKDLTYGKTYADKPLKHGKLTLGDLGTIKINITQDGITAVDLNLRGPKNPPRPW